ncbi:MAG: sulfatase-like hydrolase/transferase [Bacteroidota bacterium]
MKFIVNRIASNFQRFLHQSIYILLAYFTGLAMFFISRVLFIYNYARTSEISGFKGDVLHAFITGSRFDTVVLAYALLFLIALAITNLFLTTGACRLQKIITRIFIGFSIIVFSALMCLLIVDFYFYKFFSTHINISVFGLADDDTTAIMESVWTDYPVIKILFFVVCMVLFFVFLFSKLYKEKWQPVLKNRFQRITYFILFIGTFLFGMRCSFGNVPLEFMEASISPVTFINNLAMNGVFALKNAFSERKKGQIDVSDVACLGRFGYKNYDELTEEYIKLHGKDATVKNVQELLKSSTPVNDFLEKNPPNVIFLQMESMSSYFLRLHSEKFNLLGSLEKEIDKCYTFRNFISCRNLTILSLDGILVNSPLSPLSQSEYLNNSFSSAAVLPFNEKGYETIFTTGGRTSWRNLDQFLPRQGFSRVEGGADIVKNIPGATEEHEWGVYDEYLMKRIVQLLRMKRAKPAFIYGMTITYHTPYKIPDDYKPYPISFGPHFTTTISSTDDATLNSFKCYQYMCNSLGWLIHEISTSELGKNTIIVATGDHSSHVGDQYFHFKDEEMMDWYGVPLICYIPEAYRKSIYIDTTRFGSHKDIFPTLYNLCLSNAMYHGNGNNLFSADTTISYFGLYESSLAISKAGCMRYNNNNFVFYKWKDKPGGHLQITDVQTPEMEKVARLSRVNAAFNTYSVINEIRSTRK